MCQAEHVFMSDKSVTSTYQVEHVYTDDYKCVTNMCQAEHVYMDDYKCVTSMCQAEHVYMDDYKCVTSMCQAEHVHMDDNESVTSTCQCTVIKVPHPKWEGGPVLLLQNYPHPLSLRGRGPYHFPTPLNT